jgi:hypothetical protein
VKIVAGTWLVHLEELVVLVRNVFMSVNADFVIVVTISDSSINANSTTVFVVHSTDFEASFVTANKTRLLAGITRSASAHDRGLGKYTTSTVGVGTVLRVYGREGDGILVILSQVEVTRKPCLDATVFTDDFYELAALLIVGMVEPAATVDDVVLLQDTKTAAVRGSMGEHKDSPTLVGGVCLDSIFKPLELFLVNRHFVRSVLRRAENCGSETYK